jgi:hypothetical protein
MDPEPTVVIETHKIFHHPSRVLQCTRAAPPFSAFAFFLVSYCVILLILAVHQHDGRKVAVHGYNKYSFKPSLASLGNLPQ